MSAVHAAPAALASILLALGVGMTMVGRSWPDRPKHRGGRRRPVEEYVPAGALIPAFAIHGPGWPTAAFAYCIGCRAEVPVVVHDGAHRCDAHGHITIHTTTGER